MDILGIILCVSFFFILIGVGVGWYIIDGVPKAEARELQAKFISLGELRGKTYAQIVRVAGRPQSRAGIDDSRYSCSWNTQKYHITLQFNGDICEGVTSEIIM